MFRFLNSALCISIAFSSAAESKDGETSAMSREDEKAAALEIVRLESKTDKLRPFVLYTPPHVCGLFVDSTHKFTAVSGDASIELSVRVKLTSTSAGSKWLSGDVTVVRGSCKNTEFLGNGLVVMGGSEHVLMGSERERTHFFIVSQLNRSEALHDLIKRNCPEPRVSANLTPFVNARDKYLRFREIEPVKPLRPGLPGTAISACIFTETFPGHQPNRFYIQRVTELNGLSPLPHIEIYRLPGLRDEAEEADLTMGRCSLRSCAAEQEAPRQGEEQPFALVPENGRFLLTTLTADDWCRELDSNIPYTFQRIFERGDPME